MKRVAQLREWLKLGLKLELEQKEVQEESSVGQLAGVKMSWDGGRNDGKEIPRVKCSAASEVSGEQYRKAGLLNITNRQL